MPWSLDQSVVVGVHAGHVAGGIHQIGLDHRRAGRAPALVDEILPDQRGAAGHRRRRMAGARGGAVPLLARREKVVACCRPCRRPAARRRPVPSKQARSLPLPVMALTCCATPPVTCVPGATISGFCAAIAAGAAAGEAGHVVGAVGLACPACRSRPCPSRCCPPLVMACEWTFSAAPTVMTFLAVPGEPTVPARWTRVAGGKHDGHALVAGDRHGGAGLLRIAHQRVVLLRIDVIAAGRVRAPAVGADPRAVAIGARNHVLVIGSGESRLGSKMTDEPSLTNGAMPRP